MANPKNPWSDEEIKVLIENYQTVSYDKMEELLNRSHKSIRQKLKHLRLQKPRYRKDQWTPEEDDYLRKVYPDSKVAISQIANHVGRTVNAVRHHCVKFLMIYRPDDGSLSAYKIQDIVNTKNAYMSIKHMRRYGTLTSFCCICNYHKHVDIHHIDGNTKNNSLSNLCTLCPNHHREVEAEEHKDIKLQCIIARHASKYIFGEPKEFKIERY